MENEDEGLDPLKAAAIAPALAVAAIALSMAIKYHNIGTVQDGMARTVYIAGYLAGIEEGRKIAENKSLTVDTV